MTHYFFKAAVDRFHSSHFTSILGMQVFSKQRFTRDSITILEVSCLRTSKFGIIEAAPAEDI
jgi:hypothetical protein